MKDLKTDWRKWTRAEKWVAASFAIAASNHRASLGSFRPRVGSPGQDYGFRANGHGLRVLT